MDRELNSERLRGQEFVERMQVLSGIVIKESTDKKPLTEGVIEKETLLESTKLADGRSYGIVKENHNVLDMGTGSGIMALLAAQSGAKKVTALEFDPFVAKTAKNAINTNNFNNKINLIIGDATNHVYDKNQ